MSEKSISGHLLNLASYYIYVSWCVRKPEETLNDSPKRSLTNEIKNETLKKCQMTP